LAVRTDSNAAASRTVVAIGPGESCDGEMGTTPVVGTRPTVGLNPTHPLKAAGHGMDPSVSVPMANGASPAATAAPLPELDPPADRFSAYGLRVRPPYALHPEVEDSSRMFAHSDRFVLPSTTMPASRSLWTSRASRPGLGMPVSVSDPAVVARSQVSMLSFTSTARPWSGLSCRPSDSSRSRSTACFTASGCTVHTALMVASTASMRSSSSSTFS
jgi:hypothetical protein